jgi:hypothetical protein
MPEWHIEQSYLDATHPVAVITGPLSVRKDCFGPQLSPAQKPKTPTPKAATPEFQQTLAIGRLTLCEDAPALGEGAPFMFLPAETLLSAPAWRTLPNDAFWTDFERKPEKTVRGLL